MVKAVVAMDHNHKMRKMKTMAIHRQMVGVGEIHAPMKRPNVTAAMMTAAPNLTTATSGRQVTKATKATAGTIHPAEQGPWHRALVTKVKVM